MLTGRFTFKKQPEWQATGLQIGLKSVPVLFVHHPRARRYLLRLRADGSARVTIPRRGTLAAARDFAVRNTGWLERQLERLAAQPKVSQSWDVGTEILFRGEMVRIEALAEGLVVLGPERIRVPGTVTDLRPAIQRHLHALAARELPPQAEVLAGLHGIDITRVTVRNQKSRWGSCSRRGTISLNWRLIQTPDFVRDYIIFHELAHRRQMNHSDRFWQEVARLCPNYLVAEKWLKQQATLLR